MDNQTMMQYFEWNIPDDGLLWDRAKAQAKKLKEHGIDIVWLPPAYKGAGGVHDAGYGVYDLYDLGEFDQKGSVITKYGSRNSYLAAIKALQDEGIKVLADIVLNQRIGADEKEAVRAVKINPDNRKQDVSDYYEIEAWTKFNFPGRGGKYSDFKWDWHCFTGIDWDDRAKQSGVFQFEGKCWSDDVDGEKGNFDYLMGADVDVDDERVIEELISWGRWFVRETKVDGFRLDAVKHISFDFYRHWIDEMQKEFPDKLFIVGEYWSGDRKVLDHYLENSHDVMRLFDVPLHFNLFNASQQKEGYGLQGLLAGSLSEERGDEAITFVDNHDSQPGQSLQSWVADWFKPHAYAVILLRPKSIPCVFYADYYGLRGEGEAMVPNLRRMIMVRKKSVYGELHDYFDNNHVVGWTMEGDEEHENSGCAVLMSNAQAGEKQMYVGKRHAGRDFRDVTRRVEETIKVAADGNAVFKCPEQGVSVWVDANIYRYIIVNVD